MGGNSRPVNVDKIASDAVIDAAYEWLCERREEYSANDDVWNVRWRWAEIKPQLIGVQNHPHFQARAAWMAC